MIFRKSAPGELETIMAIVINTFNEQGIPEALDYLDEALLPVWFVAEDEGEIIGTLAAWQENGECHMGRFTVDKALRGQGIGKKLARYAVGTMFGEGTEYIVMEGRDATVKIFLEFGAVITGERFKFYDEYSTPIRLERTAFIK